MFHIYGHNYIAVELLLHLHRFFTIFAPKLHNCGHPIMKTNEQKDKKPGFLYHAFKAYIRFLHNVIFYRKTYVVNREAVPSDGTPTLIVSNHQNCMNDPLGLVTAFTDRKLNVITRADVFMVSPLANKFLRSIGLLPAFRLDYEGEGALDKNNETFRQSEQALIDGATVLMYPEAGHQDKRWLGTFSFGYTKMAFEAAELANFEKELFILPACNHYSHYFGMRNRMLVKFGTPVSIKPYYELYKTKPRTAQREVNKLVREQISNLMLDVRDLENYDTIDFIRTTYGAEYAKTQGVDPDDLPQRLLTDKQLVACLAEAKAKDEEAVNQIYSIARELRKDLDIVGITDAHLANPVGAATLGFKLLALLVLLPLWIASWWPSLPVYWIPMSIFRAKMKDPMFEGTLLFGSAALFTLPLFSLITLLTVGLTNGWVEALIYVASFPLIMLFSWWYSQAAKRTLQSLKCLMRPHAVSMMQQLRKTLWRRLDVLLKREG